MVDGAAGSLGFIERLGNKVNPSTTKINLRMADLSSLTEKVCALYSV